MKIFATTSPIPWADCSSFAIPQDRQTPVSKQMVERNLRHKACMYTSTELVSVFKNLKTNSSI